MRKCLCCSEVSASFLGFFQPVSKSLCYLLLFLQVLYSCSGEKIAEVCKWDVNRQQFHNFRAFLEVVCIFQWLSYPAAFTSLKYHLAVLCIFLSSPSVFVPPGSEVPSKVGVSLTLHLSRNNVNLGNLEVNRKGSTWNCKYHQRN